MNNGVAILLASPIVAAYGWAAWASHPGFLWRVLIAAAIQCVILVAVGLTT